MARAAAVHSSPSAPPIQPKRWLWRLLWLTPLLACIVGASIAATLEAIPDWARWTLAGIALAGVSVLGIAALIGPAARRLAGERHPLTHAERHSMTATERVEAVNAARHTLLQAVTGLVVIGGVVFTAQGLWYTAQSLDASRHAQRTADQSQVTDRYTKAVEQLGSTKLDVRLGGLYALERLAQDSSRDHQTIYDVVAAFVREHDPKPSITDKKLSTMRAATDVEAALTIVARRETKPDKSAPVLNTIRAPGVKLSKGRLAEASLIEARLFRADLTGVNLFNADLTYARMDGATLSFAVLTEAELSGANLNDANLFHANLTDANLMGVHLARAGLSRANLTYANLLEANLRDAELVNSNLTSAYLTAADLRGAKLWDAVLRNAQLAGADLTGAFLRGADLRGANLDGVVGVTESEIRKIAMVDETTRF